MNSYVLSCVERYEMSQEKNIYDVWRDYKLDGELLAGNFYVKTE